MRSIIFTVTNGLNYDQRMIRICTTLTNAGYAVLLVGVKDGSPLQEKPYRQKRLFTGFKKGLGFYAAYQLRLLFFLLFRRADIVCCIDLDTIIPVWLVSKLKGTKRVYDAHEYFSQQKEVISRPNIYRLWHGIERTFVPKFRYGYTVSASIAEAFKKEYGVEYELIRNMPAAKNVSVPQTLKEKIILYQGAVNEARGLEFLIPAMAQVNAVLHIYGDGNFMEVVKKLIRSNNQEDKVLLKGKLLPGELDAVTAEAYIGINLVENNGLNQYYSLANKFFDYLQYGIPQVTMDFPEYRKINEEIEVAILIADLEKATIAAALNSLLHNEALYARLQQNCLVAAKKFNWQQEEKKLTEFYKAI